MRVAIIGAGLQCARRAPVVVESTTDDLVTIASLHFDQAIARSRQYGCEADRDWQSAVARADVDAVIVCTPPHVHAEIAIAAVHAGKHVLCEKPLARTIDEAEAMLRACASTGRVLKCGFNHRHHPAVVEAKRRCDAGELGRLLFGRCRYGICGRPGYELEWRADPAQAAGGQFIEQGSHAIDLLRWFLGEPIEVVCMTSVHYFTAQTLDDGGMAILRMENGATASLHTTLVNWKNLFSLEIFGEDGYVVVEGLGASYGTERLSVGRRDFTAPFQDLVIEYRGGDVSWRAEWHEFTEAIAQHRRPLGDGEDGFAALSIGLAAYESERERRVASIKPRA